MANKRSHLYIPVGKEVEEYPFDLLAMRSKICAFLESRCFRPEEFKGTLLHALWMDRLLFSDRLKAAEEIFNAAGGFGDAFQVALTQMLQVRGKQPGERQRILARGLGRTTLLLGIIRFIALDTVDQLRNIGAVEDAEEVAEFYRRLFPLSQIAEPEEESEDPIPSSNLFA